MLIISPLDFLVRCPVSLHVFCVAWGRINSGGREPNQHEPSDRSRFKATPVSAQRFCIGSDAPRHAQLPSSAVQSHEFSLATVLRRGWSGRGPLLRTGYCRQGRTQCCSTLAGARSDTSSAHVLTAIVSDDDCRPAGVRRDLRTRHPDVYPRSVNCLGIYRVISRIWRRKYQAFCRATTAKCDSLEADFPGAAEPAEELDRPNIALPVVLQRRSSRATVRDRPIPVVVLQPDLARFRTRLLIAP